MLHVVAAQKPLSFLGCGAGWDVEGGIRYSAGSCTLIRNNPHDGAWILTSKHAAVKNILRYCFMPRYYDGFPYGTTIFLPDKTIAAIQVFSYEDQDIALVKLEHLVYEEVGGCSGAEGAVEAGALAAGGVGPVVGLLGLNMLVIK